MKKHLANLTVAVLVILILLMATLVSALVYVCFFYDNSYRGAELQKIEEVEFVEYDPSDINIKPLGRTGYENNLRYFSMSGSGVEFCLKGEYATFTLYGVNNQYTGSNHKPRFAVFLNERLYLDEVVDFESKDYYIDISGYENGVTVKLIKLSEALYSTFALGKIGVYGQYKIAPAPKSELKIEFIGDSITCGFGLDEENPNGYFKTETENFSKTYAYLTAENLRADCGAVAFSGYGVYSGFTTYGRNYKDVIFAHLDKAVLLGLEDNYWNYAAEENDLIVINLGTNDASYCGGSSYGRESFKNEYIKLISAVRERNPKAYILCILGDMNNALYSSIELAVEEYSASTYDYRVSAHTVSFDMGNTDIVISGHPGVLANEKAADELTDIIEDLIDRRLIGD